MTELVRTKYIKFYRPKYDYQLGVFNPWPRIKRCLWQLIGGFAVILIYLSMFNSISFDNLIWNASTPLVRVDQVIASDWQDWTNQ